MAQSIQPGRFGHIGRPVDAWLAKQETELILEPELPIIDTHHHLWDRNGWTYLLPELLADLNTGHNIVGTGATRRCGMRSSASPLDAHRPRSLLSIAAPQSGSTASTEAGRNLSVEPAAVSS
jgi:hypothetical protein